MSGLRESQHLKIPLKEIESATKNFETCIGRGGYGLVYKGELTILGKPTIVAVKRLNERLGQGLKEFLTEIYLLSGQKHPNLISLVGYCDEGNEKILVYEYAERGSLDRYLRSSNTSYSLTWVERIKICVDAARGLDHLHNHVGEHQTIIHRDIKSANILLDYDWVAKIADLGLSRLGFSDLNRSAVITHACGTPGYCEPEYIITGIVKKESDVYSFGMVLFEVLCGRLCSVKHHDGLFLSALLAKEYYEKNKLDKIIDPRLWERMHLESMSKFAEIAYRCLQNDRGRRPAMDLVIEELKESLEIQVEYESAKLESPVVLESDSDEYWETKLPRDSEDIIKRLSPRASYTSKKELFSLLHEGLLFDNQKRFFSTNKDGKKSEMISAILFFDPGSKSYKWVPAVPVTRFNEVAEFCYKERLDIRCQIRSSMLSYNTMYAVNLVFRFNSKTVVDFLRYVEIKFKVNELSVSSAHSAEGTKDGWLKIKMWFFINYKKHADFDMVIEEICNRDNKNEFPVSIQGIEFEPIDMKAEHKLESLISDDDIDWEKKLPSDYDDLTQRSDSKLQYTTIKELYVLFCAGIVIDDGKLWFSLCKLTGKKCHMLPAREVIAEIVGYTNLDWISLPESRFGEVARIQDAITDVYFTCEPRSDMFSPRSFYSSYLVFKFLNNHLEHGDSHVLEADYRLNGRCKCIPVIKPMGYDSSIPSIEGFPMPNEKHREVVHRNDSWMEVNLFKSIYFLEGLHSIDFAFHSTKMSLCGILVQGVEFRPTEIYI